MTQRMACSAPPAEPSVGSVRRAVLSSVASKATPLRQFNENLSDFSAVQDKTDIKLKDRRADTRSDEQSSNFSKKTEKATVSSERAGDILGVAGDTKREKEGNKLKKKVREPESEEEEQGDFGSFFDDDDEEEEDMEFDLFGSDGEFPAPSPPLMKTKAPKPVSLSEYCKFGDSLACDDEEAAPEFSFSETITERRERLERLVVKSMELSYDSVNFHTRSRDVRSCSEVAKKGEKKSYSPVCSHNFVVNR